MLRTAKPPARRTRARLFWEPRDVYVGVYWDLEVNGPEPHPRWGLMPGDFLVLCLVVLTLGLKVRVPVSDFLGDFLDLFVFRGRRKG